MVLRMELIQGLVHARSVLTLSPWKEISLHVLVDYGFIEPQKVRLEFRIFLPQPPKG